MESEEDEEAIIEKRRQQRKMIELKYQYVSRLLLIVCYNIIFITLYACS